MKDADLMIYPLSSSCFFFFNIYLFVCAGVLLQHAGSLVEVCGI